MGWNISLHLANLDMRIFKDANCWLSKIGLWLNELT